jgi:hypothetical protein
LRDERWFLGEEITTLAATPLSCTNHWDNDEDEDWEEDEEEEKKKGDEDAEEEEEPVWTASEDHGR